MLISSYLLINALVLLTVSFYYILQLRKQKEKLIERIKIKDLEMNLVLNEINEFRKASSELHLSYQICGIEQEFHEDLRKILPKKVSKTGQKIIDEILNEDLETYKEGFNQHEN